MRLADVFSGRAGLLAPAVVSCAVMWLWWAGHVGCYSYHFHADELGKVEQLRSGERNFNHPLLLLETARWVAVWRGAGGDLHELAVSGRLASLGFAAVTAGLLTLWAGLARGPLAAWLAGVWLAFHPRLITYGHHFKEDTALVCGIALGLAALALPEAGGLGWRRGLLRAALAGAGAGLAASGKYAGFVFAVVAVGALGFGGCGRRVWRVWRVVAGAAAAAAVFLAVNHRMIAEWPRPWEALTSEVERAQGAEPLTEVSKGRYFARLFSRPNENLLPYGLVFCAVTVWRVAARRRRGGDGGRGGGVTEGEVSALAALVFALIYGGMLAASGKLAERYWLPLHAPFGALGWMALVDAGRFVVRWAERGGRGRVRVWAVRVAAGGVAAALLFAGIRKGLRHGARLERVEDRAAMIAYIREHVPAGARIAYGQRVGLPDPGYPQQYARQGIPPLEQEVVFVRKTDDILDADWLRARGFTHAVVNADVAALRVKRRRGGGREADLREKGRLLFETRPTQRDEFPARLALYELARPE